MGLLAFKILQMSSLYFWNMTLSSEGLLTYILRPRGGLIFKGHLTLTDGATTWSRNMTQWWNAISQNKHLKWQFSKVPHPVCGYYPWFTLTDYTIKWHELLNVPPHNWTAAAHMGDLVNNYSRIYYKTLYHIQKNLNPTVW